MANVSMSVTTDMNPSGTVSTGVVTTAEAAFRRLDSAPDSLYYVNEERRYGAGLTGLIGKQYTDAQIGQIIEQSLLEDERIEDVAIRLTRENSGETLIIELQCVTPDGDFSLSVKATSSLVKLISIETAV